MRVPKTTSGKRKERFNSENTRRNLGFKEDGIPTLGGKQLNNNMKYFLYDISRSKRQIERESTRRWFCLKLHFFLASKALPETVEQRATNAPATYEKSYLYRTFLFE